MFTLDIHNRILNQSGVKWRTWPDALNDARLQALEEAAKLMQEWNKETASQITQDASRFAEKCQAWPWVNCNSIWRLGNIPLWGGASRGDRIPWKWENPKTIWRLNSPNSNQFVQGVAPMKPSDSIAIPVGPVTTDPLPPAFPNKDSPTWTTPQSPQDCRWWFSMENGKLASCKK